MNLSQIKETSKKRQQYWLLGATALLGVVLICFGNHSETVPAETIESNSVHAVSAQLPADGVSYTAELERKLAYTLSQIQGAGSVTVQITAKSTGRKEYAADTQRTTRSTIEESTDDTRQTTEEQEQTSIVQQNRNGTQQALLVEETAPELTGVLVVAEGANNAAIQEQLMRAVSALLQIPLHRVMVVPGEENV